MKTVKRLDYLLKNSNEQYEAFKHPSTIFTLVFSAPEEEIYQPKSKPLFRNYLTELSNAKVCETHLHTIVICDAMANSR